MAEKATIARPYAKAAFESARSHDAFDRWSTVLATASSVVQDERVARLLSSPRVKPEQLSGLIGEIVGGALDEQGRNFLSTLAGNRLRVRGRVEQPPGLISRLRKWGKKPG